MRTANAGRRAVAPGRAAVVVILAAVGHPVETSIGLLPFILVFALAPRVASRDPAPPGPGDGPAASDGARWRPSGTR